MKIRFYAATVLVNLLILPGIAVKAQMAPPSGLALEVDTRVGAPIHQSIPGKFFGGHYKRLATWKDDGSEQPQTFGLTYTLEGDAIRVMAFAFMDKFHDKQILIGSYLLREADKVAIAEMTRFGYEPMEVRIVPVATAFPPSPAVSSRAPSLAIIGVEPRVTNFPSYKITILNSSAKDVTYLEIRNFDNDPRPSIQAPRNKPNEILIKAGQSYEYVVKSGGPGTVSPNDFIPAAPIRIEIVSAVFSDKTFEGDLHSAARFLALMLGQKLQLQRVLALFQTNNGNEGLKSFQMNVAQLDREAPAGAVEEFATQYAGITRREYPGLKAYLEGGLDQVKKELAKDVEEYSKQGASKSFGVWMHDLKLKYETWLATL